MAPTGEQNEPAGTTTPPDGDLVIGVGAGFCVVDAAAGFRVVGVGAGLRVVEVVGAGLRLDGVVLVTGRVVGAAVVALGALVLEELLHAHASATNATTTATRLAARTVSPSRPK